MRWLLFLLRGKRFEYLTVRFTKSGENDLWWVTNPQMSFNYPTKNESVGSIDNNLTLMGYEGWEAYSFQYVTGEKQSVPFEQYIYSLKRAH